MKFEQSNSGKQNQDLDLKPGHNLNHEPDRNLNLKPDHNRNREQDRDLGLQSDHKQNQALESGFAQNLDLAQNPELAPDQNPELDHNPARRHLPKISIKIWQSALLLLAATIATMLVSLAIQPGDFADAIATFKLEPILFLYNGAPIFLVMALLYFATNHIFAATLAGSVATLLLSIGNRYKILYRDDPLVPEDLFSTKEALAIVKQANLEIETFLIVGILAIIVLHVLALFISRPQKMTRRTRIIGMLCATLIAGTMHTTVYSSKEIYENLPVNGQRYSVTDNFTTKGFVYCFLYNLTAYSVDKPEGYTQGEIERLIDQYSGANTLGGGGSQQNGQIDTPGGGGSEQNGQSNTPGGGSEQNGQSNTPGGGVAPNDQGTAASSRPHVIMIMGEAFSDLSDNEHLVFSENDNPLRHTHALGPENIASGHLIVPNFGGGTANTEFDALTGCSTLNLSESSTSAFRTVRKETESVASLFQTLDYATIGIHPGYDWFYNRKNVYKHLGFQETIFENDFDDPAMKGHFISEEATIDRIIEEFERHAKENPNVPLFEFCVTIQNHSPYNDHKYGGLARKTFTTDLDLSETAIEQLANYFEGIRDADLGIKRLADHFRDWDEPVVLVYFGDHLPSMGGDYSTYKELGYELDDGDYLSIEAFKVPYFIWANEVWWNDAAYGRSARPNLARNAESRDRAALDRPNQLNVTANVANRSSTSFDRPGGLDFIDARNRIAQGQFDALGLPDDGLLSTHYLGPLLFDIIGHESISPFFAFLNEFRKIAPVVMRDLYYLHGEYVVDPGPQIAETNAKYQRWQYYQTKRR